MTILFTSNLSGMGGGEVSILYIMKKLLIDNDIILLCAQEGELPQIAREFGIKVYIDNFKRKNILQSYKFFKKLQVKEQFQVIHNNECSATLLFGLFAKICRHDIGNFWTCHGQWYKFSFLKALAIKSLADSIFCVSQNVYDNLKRQNINNIVLSYLGIDLKKQISYTKGKLREELKLSDSSIIIATIARYEKVKGQIKAIKGLEPILLENRSIHYVLIGGSVFGNKEDDTYYKETMNVIESSLAYKQIHVLGERHDIMCLYPDIDLLLVPSDRESLSMVTLEALSQEVPVISTPCQGPQEIMCNNDNMICKENSSEGIYDAVHHYLNDVNIGNQVQIDTLSLKKRIENLFDVDRIATIYSMHLSGKRKMIHLENKTDCSGCMLCKYQCPSDAITMVADDEGFLYPQIDKSKCCNCGLCDKACSLKEGNIEKNKSISIYAARNKNKNLLQKVSSGGVFSALSDSVIKKQGLVVATLFDSSYVARFDIASNKNQVEKMLGSKYVQSYIEDIFIKVKEQAYAGQDILFVGTPCQVNAMKIFLKGIDEKVIYVDLICHGVPSPKIWKAYIEHLLNKENSEVITNINFRDKSSGWKTSHASCIINNKTINIQSYMELYGEASIIRPSCYNCPFASNDRISDLTIGDFWGIEEIDQTWYSAKEGTSMIMVNSQKGQILLEQVTEYLDLKKFGLNIPLQMNLNHPTKESCNRTFFWNAYEKYGLKYILIRFGGEGVYGRIRKTLGKIKRSIKG